VRAFAPVAAAVLLVAAPARAEPTPQQLFDEGLKEMLAGSYQSGCGKLARSYERDPQPGALFTHAACLARWGKLQSAAERYEEYLAVVGKLPPDKRKEQSERAANAAAKLKELKAQVPTVTVELSSAPAGTRVEIDSIAREAGTPLPLDPGKHVVRAVTTTGDDREETVDLQVGEARRVQLSFADLFTPPPPKEDDGGPDGLLVGAFVAGGVGLAGLVLGGVTGGLVLSKKSVVDDNCQDVVCNQAGLDAAEEGKTLGTVSTVGFVVGGVGAAAAIVLFVMVATDGGDGEASALRVDAKGIGVAW
jgi:hypothetical protein